MGEAKTAAEAVTNADFQQPSATGDSEKPNAQDNRVIDRLFDRMVAEFGHRFTSIMPTEAARESTRAVWAERLAGLSLDEIRRGLDSMPKYARNHDGWPPGASEFRGLCRPHREPYERPEFQRNALPQKPASRETALKHLRGIRRGIDD